MPYKGLLKLPNRPSIRSSATVVGKKEMDGPLSSYFDLSDEDDKFGQKTWEQAESEMARMAFETALMKGMLTSADVDVIFAGDLLNQCTSQSFGLLSENIPYIGIYGACSNMAESLMLSALFVNASYAKIAAASTASHFCTAERQFRFPLEYGAQRTPTSQNTVTGAACFIVEQSENIPTYINEVMPGKIVDMGITDANNMGAAMAGAAADTLKRYFMLSDVKSSDFDMIITGDLGKEGLAILKEISPSYNLSLGDNLTDCGVMIYDIEKQDMHSGGSGCGCSGVVMAGYINELFNTNKLKDVLFVGTGALLSPGSVMQKLSIPGIAHLVRITRREM